MEEKLQELVKIQNETVGSSFSLGYLKKEEKYIVRLVNKLKYFTAYDPVLAIDLTIDWIKNNRKTNKGNTKYTLF